MDDCLDEVLIISAVIDKEKAVIFLEVDSQVCEVLLESCVAVSRDWLVPARVTILPRPVVCFGTPWVSDSDKLLSTDFMS